MGCGYESDEKDCEASDRDGTCACTTNLCNTAARPGMATASASALMIFASIAKYIFA